MNSKRTPPTDFQRGIDARVIHSIAIDAVQRDGQWKGLLRIRWTNGRKADELVISQPINSEGAALDAVWTALTVIRTKSYEYWGVPWPFGNSIEEFKEMAERTWGKA